MGPGEGRERGGGYEVKSRVVASFAYMHHSRRMANLSSQIEKPNWSEGF